MPVQINEVIVKAVVNATASSGSTQVECQPSGNSGKDAELLEKILEIIRDKKER